MQIISPGNSKYMHVLSLVYTPNNQTMYLILKMQIRIPASLSSFISWDWMQNNTKQIQTKICASGVP